MTTGESQGGLVHVTSVAEWERAQRDGELRPPSLGAVGFVHLSTWEQLEATLARHFVGRTGLIVLAIDPGRCEAGIRWEEGEPGELFPHLYGPLPVAAVTSAQERP